MTRHFTALFGIDLPIIQAPMAGNDTPALAIAVANAGGLGSLGCAMLSPEQVRAAVATFRAESRAPLNLNFFCHASPPADADQSAWRTALAPYYAEHGLDANAPLPPATRTPFDEAYCAVVEECRPQVVSFHFGLPSPALLDRVRATGAKVVCSATTVAEARHLDEAGCDAIVAMGQEAGGHRGTFLATAMTQPVGIFSLLPQVVDVVKVPVIAAGGIADPRGVAAAFALGASAVQVGTAYLFCPEAKVSALHRAALASAQADETAITNVFTGRPARGIVNRLVREQGPISTTAPPFPLASAAVLPLRAAAEAAGRGDFTNLWSGQSARLARAMSAADMTHWLAQGLPRPSASP